MKKAGAELRAAARWSGPSTSSHRYVIDTTTNAVAEVIGMVVDDSVTGSPGQGV